MKEIDKDLKCNQLKSICKTRPTSKTNIMYSLIDDIKKITEKELLANREKALNLEPKEVVDDYNISKKNNESIIEKVFRFYKEKYNNCININELGEVLLDKKAIKDDIAHGLNKEKAKAFIAVPYVIKEGFVTGISINYKGKEEDRIIYSAPISIDSVVYIENVVLRQTKKTKKEKITRLYLHDVILIKKESGNVSFIDSALNIIGNRATSSASIINISNVKQDVNENTNNVSTPNDIHKK